MGINLKPDWSLIKEKFIEFVSWGKGKNYHLTKWDFFFLSVIAVITIAILIIGALIGVKYLGWTVS